MKNVITVNFKKLKEHATSGKWSCRRIAKEAGTISHGTAWAVLEGKQDPKAATLKQICDVIGLPIEEAFTEKQAA